MNLSSVWAQLEQEITWRQQEVRFLSNTRNAIPKEVDRLLFLRSQVVMLYAHAEGFAKVALLIYLRYVNSRQLRRYQVNDALIASACEEVFHALRFGDKQRKVFRDAPPTDEKLLTFLRRVEFVRDIDNFVYAPLVLPEETVDTESNLTGEMLRKNFLRLGFPPDLLSEYQRELTELASRRHVIAHGGDNTVRLEDYERLQRAVFVAMDHLALTIVESLEQNSYMRPERTESVSLCAGEMR